MVTILAEPGLTESGGLSAEAFPRVIELPGGLIGFPEFMRFDLIAADDQGPFFWLRPRDGANVEAGFLVLEPSAWMPGYRLEISDEDAVWLSLEDEGPPWVFNIVTLPATSPERATVNLLGPLVVRRKDGVGKQIILANHHRYSATQPLTGETGG